MGKVIFWIFSVLTAILAAGIFWAGAMINNLQLGILFSFVAVILAAIADRQDND